ncbi:hypothetical protein [Lentilactobacillus farraginis]|uniref:Uncharacterized protein n=1 Tax=Lentilactobacillus farraginis DSM 18382 = JCM 14108 TaxID=1423743 RepID=X0PAY1_9LACO|nr:hypothetical protein [Lentilactobacillus farraginis]KRM08768.1 hypothetical protein FD41_GL000086 [Lentilactobacillus farraginis DSM 18382 = JCM 14108]GAF36763.1 hypothetical protein JCM14108_1746 [Lentilactobacillus farraginis DSM 18382 = JCM 14108]
MNATKQSIINDLIDIMSHNESSAIRNLSMRVIKTARPIASISSTPQPAESIPANHSLACFNIAAELTRLMMNDVNATKIIVKKYSPGIVDALVYQHPTDYNNPQDVKRVISDWLGIKTIEQS